MTQENDTTSTIQKSLTWLSIAATFLSLVEKLLPAALVTWNNYLRQKNRELEVKLARAKMQMKVKNHHDTEEKQNGQKSGRTIISEFLTRKSKPSPDDTKAP